MIERNFNLHLTAGHSTALVINVNQFDQGEKWIFTLYNENGTQYIPSTGAIVGIKSDGLGIINSGSVVDGKVVIMETEQMTAAVGKAVFELMIDSQTHGTANFIVLVEPKPGNNADLSESDLSLLQEAIDATSPLPTGGSVGQVLTKTANGSTWSNAGTPTQEQVADAVSDWADEHITVSTGVVIDTSLSVAGAAADAKKTGDEITDLKNALANASIKDSVKQALLGLADAVGYKNDSIGATARNALYHALYDAELLRITAVFTQGTNIIYDDDSLDELKQYLTVTAYYDDGTSGAVTSYTLSGTLTVGTSTITVTYSGETTTFNVTVSAGIPSGYTVYDYIQVANDKGNVVNTAVPESWITLKPYDNLDRLSWNLIFSALTGYTRGSALLGARMESNVITGDAVYIGSTTSNSIGISSDRSRMVAHGVSTVFSPNAITLGEVNTFVFTNTSESPSEFAFNGVATEMPWSEQLTVTRGLTLFTNPTPTATSMTLQRYLRIGALKLYDLSGNLVGDYLPCVRTSDTRIGMFDRVTQTFFTSSTASYTTVGNSSCYYTVGNWS